MSCNSDFVLTVETMRIASEGSPDCDLKSPFPSPRPVTPLQYTSLVLSTELSSTCHFVFESDNLRTGWCNVLNRHKQAPFTKLEQRAVIDGPSAFRCH